MKLKFAKMHGLGNDFAVIDAINQSFVPRPELVQRWADRFDGIGFDQMLIVERPQSDVAAFRYRIYNADGSEVAQCGNGARCFARFVREQGMTDLDIPGGNQYGSVDARSHRYHPLSRQYGRTLLRTGRYSVARANTPDALPDRV